MHKKIILMIVFSLFLTNTSIFKANSFNGYTYTSTKQDGGLAYEITNVILNSNGLMIEGWAYNNNFDSPEDETPDELDEDEIYARGLDKKKTDKKFNFFNLLPITKMGIYFFDFIKQTFT